MRLIGLTGLKTAGKDTVASIIKAKHDDVQRVAFADNLKLIAGLAIGVEGDVIGQMNDCKEKWELEVFRGSLAAPIHSLTGRQYLQRLGDNARNIFGESFWVDQVLPPIGLGTAAQRYPKAQTVVITDCRYTNEASRIQAHGGKIWEVVRPGVSSDGHASELPLPPEMIDEVIHNDGSLDDLARKVQAVL